MSERIKTTVVGSYPVPSWLVGNTSRLVLRDAVMVVLKTQELAGLDLIADGELSRFDTGHPETNGMIDYFVGQSARCCSAMRRSHASMNRAANCSSIAA
jgi:methionine synthase II (cobalamin-independent)